MGKTTTAIHLARYFSDKGATVLVDGDDNKSSLKWASSGLLPFEVIDEKQGMKAARKGYDFMIIDTAARPQDNEIKDLAAGCDLLILPTRPDKLSAEATMDTVNILRGTNYCVLITMKKPYPNKDAEDLKEALTSTNVPVFKSDIRDTIGISKAASEGVTLAEVSDSRVRIAWNDYVALGAEVEALL